MKIELHIPVEQYGFIAAQVDCEPNEVASVYNQLAGSFRPKPTNSLPDKEYDAFIERQISGGTNTVDSYYAMSPEQQKYVQIIKRAIKRINYKLDKPQAKSFNE